MKMRKGEEYPEDLKTKHDHLRTWALDTFEKILQQHPGDFVTGDNLTIADL